jgi:hypothetical protein
MTAGRWRTYHDLSEDVAHLLAEANAALSSNRWAIRNTGSKHVFHRLYDAAALRHCCLLLKEIEQSVRSGQDMTVRLAGRALVEAWITAVYLHFGGYDALSRIVQNTLKQTDTLDKELKAFDQQLAKAKAKGQAKLAEVQRANTAISEWNRSHPEQPPKPLLDEPHVPQLAPTGIDLSGRVADFSRFTARGLSVSEMVAALTKLGPEKDFANEDFAPIYLLYRMLSTGGAHANIHVYESYFRPNYFVSTTTEPNSPPTVIWTLTTALYSVALLTQWVLSEPGHPTPVASQLRDLLQPDPTGRSGWTPGV